MKRESKVMDITMKCLTKYTEWILVTILSVAGGYFATDIISLTKWEIFTIYLIVGVVFWSLIKVAGKYNNPSRGAFIARSLAYNVKQMQKDYWPDGGLKPTDSDIYNYLMKYYLQQDQLSWSRIQSLGVVEGGVLVAGYQLGPTWGLFALVIGSAIVFLILLLIRRDWQLRDQNLELLDTVHQPKGIRMIIEAKPKFTGGSSILSYIVWMLLMANLTLICWHLYPHQNDRHQSPNSNVSMLGIPLRTILDLTGSNPKTKLQSENALRQ